ncbi:GNAT family N-acetyltransferase [Nocardia sp. NPDC050406]|uniref:GNAT family N-acetyltransferase n=1 Tax=Nocardia sp. NPDC050406 TaxID=3364318 RepID=UPI003794F820
MSGDWQVVPTLRGKHVRLEPLSAAHAEGLFESTRDPGIWAWLSMRQPESADVLREWIVRHVAAEGVRAFAQVDAETGAVAGTTSYYEVDPVHRALAIGYTWLGSAWQRTGVNTEAKLLLLEYAFEELGAIRVVWHTDIRNLRSQRAIERLGAQREAVLRQHRIRPDGSLRDTAQYSMLDVEWPGAAARLRARLER